MENNYVCIDISIFAVAIGGIVLLVASALKTEEQKIEEQIEYFESLLKLYEETDTEDGYYMCADIRDRIEELKLQLQTLQNKK